MRFIAKKSIMAVAALAAASPLLAQDQDGVGNVSTSVCDGGPMDVSGEDNRIRITGYCSILTVSGTNNMVVVDRAGRIEVEGTENIVRYIQLNPGKTKTAPKVHPGKTVTGTGNVTQWTKGVVPKSPQ